ncbi:hypothetical protein IMSHALPRED_005179 [Imshaugia aleurites]|uniref:DAGKc domain-containing protein n=1 Tax=Imshaugia aleurites TaxID=172621 RepID=A0A8H3FBF4_9LECA|nr:hypothetical protein IMSHALPRED_005179 [Imshaugia aleurites]
MPGLRNEDRRNDGTIRGKDANFSYDAEEGILSIKGDSWLETILDRSVIAVIDGEKGGESGTKNQQILLLSKLPGTRYKFEDVQATDLPQSFIDANAISPHFEHLKPSRSNSRDGGYVRSLYVIISIGSGTGEAQDFFDNVVKPAFGASGVQPFSYYVHTTDSHKSIERFISAVILPRANEGVSQTILLLSGDGGVVDTVNVLLSSKRSEQYVKPAIGLVSMGTGNALANSTGLNGDLTRGLRHFYRGKAHPMPTFTATFSPDSEILLDEGRAAEPVAPPAADAGEMYGAVVCSWALHASLVADSDTAEYRKFGSQRFQMAAKELLSPSDGSAPHIYKGRITLFKLDENGHEMRQMLNTQEHGYILTTLVSNLEENLTISPHSKPLDGQLRIVHFGAIPSEEVMKILGLAFQGGAHVGCEAVSYESIEGFRIEFDEPDGRWRRVCVDGRIVRVGESGWVEVRKNTSADVLDIVVDLEG